MKCPNCHFENPSDTRFCGKCATPLLTTEKMPFSRTMTLHAPINELAIGSVFAKRYQIIEVLGIGGMGKVYKVFDKKIKEIIALKLLNPEIAVNEKMIERFQNELKFARKISHKNICRMYHLSEEKDAHYLTMEYVQGEDLKSFIKQVGQLPVKKAISVAKQVCKGLAEAHKHGVVHRDLKPQNIMIDKDGNVRIMDFGIARSLQKKGITETGVIIGTPDYMTPEQVEGKDVDQRSDIYSIGVIIYEMVTGAVPFEGDTALSVAVKHKTETPSDPRNHNDQIPEVLSRLILKCMEKDRENRHQSIEALHEELAKVEQGLPATEKIRLQETKKQKVSPISKIKLIWITALISVFIIIFGGYPLWKGLIRSQHKYENLILLDIFVDESNKIEKNLIEYPLLRSLEASTQLHILVQNDFMTYKRKTELKEEKARKPLISITCETFPKITGFEILISMRNKEKTFKKKFDCKGPLDFISSQIDNIHSYISLQSDGVIEKIKGERSFSDICTNHWDALTHFLKGENAWKKLKKNDALYEFQIAFETDPDFGLAHLRFAEVMNFFLGAEKEETKKHLDIALKKQEKLIEYDLLKLKALMARINSNRAEERQYLGQLAEAFPFKKEYLYEFAESYFKGGEAQEAIKHYSKALEIDSNYSQAHNHIAYCYAWIENHALAERHLKKYVKLDNTENSYDSLAAAYMFAGKYDEAIKALEKAKNLNPSLDYLYGSLANIFILKGLFAKAIENLKEEIAITERESTKMNARFSLAFVEYLRGNIEKSIQELEPIKEFYLKEPYRDNIDESSNLPFWLTGVIAAKNGDLRALKEMLNVLERKIVKKGVNTTNYSRIFKFFNHLKILEGFLQNDLDIVLTKIEEGCRIKEKVGYWGSIFNLSYIFNEYAEILINLNRTDKAQDLLHEVIEYNPNYAKSYLNLTKIHLTRDDLENAKITYQKAQELLSESDKNFIWVVELKKIEKELLSNSVSN